MSLPFFHAKHPRYTGENLEKNKVLYTRIEMLSKKYGCTPAQLALSWVLHQGEDVVAIPGIYLDISTSRIHQTFHITGKRNTLPAYMILGSAM